MGYTVGPQSVTYVQLWVMMRTLSHIETSASSIVLIASTTWLSITLPRRRACLDARTTLV